MKLPIRHKYFQEIKSGKKDYEYRDAHITFVDEKTNEELKRNIVDVGLVLKESMPDEYKNRGLFDDDMIIRFKLKG